MGLRSIADQMDKHQDRDDRMLAEAIQSLVREVHAFRKQVEEFCTRTAGHSENQILTRIEKKVENIMSAISVYAEQVEAAFTDIGTSVDTLVTGVTGIAGDVAGLKDLILKLQSNPGPITPEDQAILDQLIVKITALADRIKPLAETVQALDAATDEVPAPPE